MDNVLCDTFIVKLFILFYLQTQIYANLTQIYADKSIKSATICV